MPWSASSARRHNRKAVGKKGTRWARVANSMKRRGYSDKRAIMAANAVIGRSSGRKKRRD